MAEEIFFNDDSVYVSNSRFIVNSKTYAMSNVTSVQFGFKPGFRGRSWLAVIIGLFCLLGQGWLVTVGWFLIIVGALSWWRTKSKYSLILHTLTGGYHALESDNSLYIREVIDALNEAIVSRG